jgi:hypothetical protein
LPWLTRLVLAAGAGFAAAAAFLALACGVLPTTPVTAIATSALATLNASAIAHLPLRGIVSGDRHLVVLRSPVLLLESGEGAMSVTFYRQ